MSILSRPCSMRHGAWDYTSWFCTGWSWIMTTHDNTCFPVHQPSRFSSVDSYLPLAPFLSSFGRHGAAPKLTWWGIWPAMCATCASVLARLGPIMFNPVKQTSSTCMTNKLIITSSCQQDTYAHFLCCIPAPGRVPKRWAFSNESLGKLCRTDHDSCLVDSTQYTRI